jgi:anaerobic ribonucleoside-triphosphate reductase activating protein
MKVQIAGIVKESVTDGSGIRTTIFFQGCEHHCPGCHNPHTWAFDGGYSIEVEALIAQIPFSPLIKGVTLSGGDPFYQPRAAAFIAKECKKLNKDVWAYSGFTWEQLRSQAQADRMELLRSCDVLVDGPFVQSLMCFDLPFRGSSNQRLIDVQESLCTGALVEMQIDLS